MSGRASLYTPEIAERILQELSGGRSLRAICRDEGMPRQNSVQRWVVDDRDGFAARYKEARKMGNPEMRSYTSLYTAETAERILGELRRGRALDDICEDDSMPAVRTVSGWAKNDCDGFSLRYLEARAAGRALMARRTLYTPEIADLILEELCLGRTLTAICGDPGMPSMRTVQQWVVKDHDGFKARCREAREFGYYAMSDQVVDIADDSKNDWIERHGKDGSSERVVDPENIQRSRLRCTMRLSLLAKVQPKTFGDRVDPNSQREGGSELDELLKEIDGRTRGLPSQRLLPNLVDDL